MVVKQPEFSAKEMEKIVGGVKKHNDDKTYDGGTLQEIIVTP